MTINSCAIQGIYLSDILHELDWKHFKTFGIPSDNRDALHLATNGNYSNRSKRLQFVSLHSVTGSNKTESSLISFY